MTHAMPTTLYRHPTHIICRPSVLKPERLPLRWASLPLSRANITDRVLLPERFRAELRLRRGSLAAFSPISLSTLDSTS